MRPLALILFLFTAVFVSTAAETNYFCIICGKGPLSGQIWLSKRGAICADCYKLENHCSLCGLPVRDGDGHVKTGDGRFICKFDRPDAVLDVAEARAVFAKTRRELIELFGSGFVLNYPDVTVNLFDVDYWSEAGHSDGLHKFGFASTRKTAKGSCTHEVVLLSGRLRTEIEATAAHEYTHLWINENLSPDRSIARNANEAVCELVAYKLMELRGQTEQMQRILDNPYTHGEITKLVALEKERGIGYILNWVKTGTTSNFQAAARMLLANPPPITLTNLPPPLPATLKLGGLMSDGKNSRAIINGVSFEAGETQAVKLRSGTVQVRCLEIHSEDVLIQVNGKAKPVTLKIAESFAP